MSYNVSSDSEDAAIQFPIINELIINYSCGCHWIQISCHRTKNFLENKRQGSALRLVSCKYLNEEWDRMNVVCSWAILLKLIKPASFLLPPRRNKQRLEVSQRCLVGGRRAKCAAERWQNEAKNWQGNLDGKT